MILIRETKYLFFSFLLFCITLGFFLMSCGDSQNNNSGESEAITQPPNEIYNVENDTTNNTATSEATNTQNGQDDTLLRKKQTNNSPNSNTKNSEADSSPALLTKTRAMPKVNRGYIFPYDLDRPDFTGNLPRELMEISGLTYNPTDNTLFAINDELGRFYTLNAEDCSLVDKKNFGRRGDYEGLELVGDILYIVKSNGRLAPINLSTMKGLDEIRTPLSSSNDVEGLGFDPKTNELVLACKGNPAIKKKHKLKDMKAFYAFDLDRRALREYPKFTISDKQLEDFFEDHLEDDLSKKEKKKRMNRLEDFSPSGIAKHPIDQNFYILSSAGKLLLVCNSYGRIEHIEFLDSNKFAQPEGICFTPNGRLYVSNEGRGFKAKVMWFDHQ